MSTLQALPVIDWFSQFSKTSQAFKASEIRMLLAAVREDPETISFGGGFPSELVIPRERIQKATNRILDSEDLWRIALQYGPTQGEPALRKAVAHWLYRREKISVGIDHILPTIGSQEALYMLGKLFVNPGDYVVCGLPSYLAAIQAFITHRARFIGIPVDDEGMRVDLLKKELAERKRRGKKLPKFIYVIPDYQNPSGVTLSLERRKTLLDLAVKYRIPIIEDTPYRELYYHTKKLSTIYSLDTNKLVIMCYSFSKILCGGFRLGVVVGPEMVIEKLILLKQAIDLNSPPLIQLVAADLLKDEKFMQRHLGKSREYYKEKKDLMLDMLKKYMPAGVNWTRPKGGLFLWIRLPERMDGHQLLEIARAKKVVFVPGKAFHCDSSGNNTLRINFSYPSEKDIVEGVKRLAEAIREY